MNDGGEGAVGFYDCNVSRLRLADGYEDRTYEIMEALRPFLGRSVPRSLRDLIPGVAAAPEIEPEAGGPGPDRTRAKRATKDERVVEKRLNRLRKDGWTIVSSIRQRSGADIDYVVIGPPGVFAVTTKHHPSARVWVGEDMVHVDGAEYPDYLRTRRGDAESAARALTDAVGLDVVVIPVLAFVGTASIDADDSSGDVLITDGEGIEQALLDRHAVYSMQERETIHSVARRAEIWLA
ncbi:MAG TPA: nuclease-related domain-containing protein [Actinospica sp.]|nr:nuclease-related domain-containing protein [Actinospica sp.]